MNSSKAEASRFSARKRSLSYRGRQHHIVAPFGKPCIEGCVGHTDRQPIHVAPLRLDGPWQLADILAHRGQHGSYGVFLLGFQIFQAEASRNKLIKEKIRRVAPPPPVKFEQLFDTIVAIVAKGCPEVGPALFNPLCKSHCIATQLSGCPLFICFDDGPASPNVTDNTKTTRSRRGGEDRRALPAVRGPGSG